MVLATNNTLQKIVKSNMLFRIIFQDSSLPQKITNLESAMKDSSDRFRLPVFPCPLGQYEIEVWENDKL